MPSRLPWSKSNKSQASVGGTSTEHLPPSEHPEQSTQNQRLRPSEGPRQRQYPERSSSRRLSAHLLLERPTVNVPPTVNRIEPSPSTEHPPAASNHYPSSPSENPDQPHEKRSLRRRLGWGHSSRESDNQQPPSNKSGLGRSVSLRKKESPVAARYNSRPVEDQQRPSSFHWGQQGSSPQLPTSPEQDDDDDDKYDPFLIRDDKTSLSAPTEPSSPVSGLTSDQHQEQHYQQSQISRVNSDLTYPSRSSAESYYYQEQRPRYLNTQLHQEPQYQNTATPHQLAAQEHDQHYRPFHPSPAVSPLPGPSHQQEHSHRQPYQFQPKDIQHLQPSRPPSLQQQDLHLLPDRPRSRQQHQHPADIQGQQTVRLVPQIQQQQGLQYLQTARPPSQHQKTPPPSRGSQVEYTSTQRQDRSGRDESAPPHSSGSMPQLQKNSRGQESRPAMVQREISSLNLDQQHQVGQGPPTPGLGGFNSNGGQTGPQGQQHRGGQPRPETEHGRGTPPPGGTSAADMSEEEVRVLMRDHKELREKYTKVKKYYFEKEAQVHALQNTLAHQRLSMSRTSLDDSEYVARFTRLDGLISQLAYSIRKSWKAIPSWLHASVNKDAVQTGKQEMTAVGRAFISGWLVDELFDKYFHPELDTGLSTQLKAIQHNIRRFAPGAAQTGEEEEALVAKIITWRLATLEGLADQLRQAEAGANRQRLVDATHQRLVLALQAHQVEPAPSDLDGGVYMIAELAVNIAVHLPLESRDVHITYFQPGHPVAPDVMKVESGIPALTNPIAAFLPEAEDEGGEGGEGGGEGKDASGTEQQQQQEGAGQANGKEGGRRAMFGNFIGATKKPVPGGAPQAKSTSQISLSQGGPPQGPGGAAAGGGSQQGKDDMQRVRMAAGVALEIRGRSVLVKAPVFGT